MQYLGTHETLVRQSYDWSETPPSIAVLHALAAIEDVPPTDLHDEAGITLYGTVDLEALDALLTHESDISLSFSVENYTVFIEDEVLTVRADDAIRN